MGTPVVTIDCSAETYSARCVGCAYVGPPHIDKMDARRDADNHRRREHPEQLRDTLKKRRRRARALR